MGIEFYAFLSFLIFFIFTFLDLYKLDILYAFFYAALFIYTIFSQIGYVYFPILSELRNANYGMKVFWEYYFFVFLSFITFYCVLKFLSKIIRIHKPLYSIKFKMNNNKFILFVFVIFIFLSLFFIVIIKYGSTIYYGKEDMGIIGFMYKRNALIAFVLYVLYRQNTKNNISFIYLFLFVLSLTLELFIAPKIGSRQDVVSLALGIIGYELYLAKIRNTTKKIVIKLFIFLFILIMLLTYIREHRQNYAVNKRYDFNLIEEILNQDYFSPSYMLFTSINYNYIKPDFVIKSNLANSLVKLNVPYLQEELGNLMMPGSSSRQSSFAFYSFTEGYIFCGFLGFLYNGLIFSFYIFLWRNLARSNNIYFNAFLIGLFVSQVFNLSRGQSAYFIKYLYLTFPLPLLIYFLGSGIKIKLRSRNCNFQY